jgi:hypothetical protein
MSIAMDGNKQEGKWLVVEHNALSELKQIMPFPKDHVHEFPW